jgi:murein tripeptide amidase MpaA
MQKLLKAVTNTDTMSAVGVILLAGNALAGPNTQPAEMARFDGEVVVRVQPRGDADLRLMDQLSDDPWTCGTSSSGAMDYRVSREKLATLTALGVPFRVLVEDVQALIDADLARRSEPFENRAYFDDYADYAGVSNYVNTLVATHPGFVTRISLGDSVEGREIFAMRVTSPVPPIGGVRKPVVVLNSLQHAREWITVTSNLYATTELLSTYSTDAASKAILDEYELVIIPITNPDGYNHTWTSNRLWRKNRRVTGTSTRGIDLNRNWSVGWGLSSGSSGNLNSEIYRGPSPLSEPETQALSSYMLSVPKVVAHIDIHSYSQLILRVWGHKYEDPSGLASITRIGTAMRDSIAAATGATYTFGGAEILYLASGTAPDWVFGTLGAFAITAELRDTGTNGFVLPPSFIVPTGNDALAMVKTMIQKLCRADFTKDNVVDDSDFVAFAAAYEKLTTNVGDLTGDGVTDDADFVLFAGAYAQLLCR